MPESLFILTFFYSQKITNIQKKSISKYSRYIYELRQVTTNLTNALDADIKDTNISTMGEKLKILNECYTHTSILLDQLSVVLKCIPENALNTEPVPEFDAVLSDTPLARCYKNNEEWRELYKKLKSITAVVEKQKGALHKIVNATPKQIGDVKSLPNVCQTHIDVTNDARRNLAILIEQSEAILQEYQFKFRSKIVEDFHPQHPVLRCVDNLIKHLNDTSKELDKLDGPFDHDMNEDSSATIIAQTEDIVATMLLIIQSLYKKHLPANESTDNIDVLDAIDEIIDGGKKEKEESKEILEDKHLKEPLHEKLSTDSKMLQLDVLINKIRCLLSSYVQYIATRNETEDMRNAMMRLVPILEQTVLFAQYFLSQKVAVHRVSCKMLSVLLKIFSDLAVKGCVYFFLIVYESFL